jgi:hypothetical protein
MPLMAYNQVITSENVELRKRRHNSSARIANYFPSFTWEANSFESGILKDAQFLCVYRSMTLTVGIKGDFTHRR